MDPKIKRAIDHRLRGVSLHALMALSRVIDRAREDTGVGKKGWS